MRPLPPAALACLAAALLAGCGGDDSAAPAPRGPNTVVMTDYEYHPRDVRVRAGRTLTVVNEGGIAHNLTVERGPNPREETDELAGTNSFLKGDSERLRVDLAPGRYAIVCTVPGHRELGMTGSLTVR
ncbi:MAG: plastocyanin/azurin family copper-binding protein [Solirubrobacterales bacterium]